MNAIPALGQWTFTGVTTTPGACDCCARRITARTFAVSHPEHGDMLLGRRCAARATGFAAGAVEREERMARRRAETSRRGAILVAAAPHADAGDLAEARVSDRLWTAVEGGEPTAELWAYLAARAAA